jgi:hypothetical protein
MATAKKVPADSFDVQLTLTKREAELLRRIFAAIGGDPAGPRGEINKIAASLDAIEIYSADEPLNPVHHSIYFE